MIGTMTDLQARILNELCIIYPSSLNIRDVAVRVGLSIDDAADELVSMCSVGWVGRVTYRSASDIRYMAAPLGIKAHEELNQYPPYSSDPDKVMCFGRFTFHNQPLTQ